jgi:hypothetical protein
MSSGLSKNRIVSERRSAAIDLLRAAALPVAILPVALFAWLHMAASAIAVEPVAVTGEQISKLIQTLDHPDYDTRHRADRQLRELARRKDLQPILAEQLQRVLIKEGVSYEVRSVLADLRRSLPATEAIAPAEVSQEEIGRLLDELRSDSFAKRVGARQRLTWLLDNPADGVRIMTDLKSRLAGDVGADEDDIELGSTIPAEAITPDEDRPAGEDRQPLVTLWREVRARWLASPTEWPLAKVEEKQWRQWITDLCREGDDVDVRNRRVVATRELRDLLAREAYLEPIEQALKKQLDYTGDSPATRRVERLLAWLHPAMVAEVWSDGQHVTIQHLLVDVPQVPDGAPRATHFDRIDDRTAHCASGNNLEPGDYPVGVAIPHPRGQNMMFHLINLPTPRRRMAYPYQAHLPQADRRREISQRTMDAVVAGKRRLTQAELGMLPQLDAQVISQFVGPYFKAVPDRPLKAGDGYPSIFTTEHEIVCSALADIGTHEAIDALEKAAIARQADTTSPQAQYPVAWIAALAIAQRDPWNGVDAWLASLIERDTPLTRSADPVPELGASAAFLLLHRHDQSPRAFGLVEVADDMLQASGVSGYRFSEPADRAAVLAWWAKQKSHPTELDAGG